MEVFSSDFNVEGVAEVFGVDDGLGVRVRGGYVCGAAGKGLQQGETERDVVSREGADAIVVCSGGQAVGGAARGEVDAAGALVCALDDGG